MQVNAHGGLVSCIDTEVVLPVIIFAAGEIHSLRQGIAYSNVDILAVQFKLGGTNMQFPENLLDSVAVRLIGVGFRVVDIGIFAVGGLLNCGELAVATRGNARVFDLYACVVIIDICFVFHVSAAFILCGGIGVAVLVLNIADNLNGSEGISAVLCQQSLYGIDIQTDHEAVILNYSVLFGTGDDITVLIILLEHGVVNALFKGDSLIGSVLHGNSQRITAGGHPFVIVPYLESAGLLRQDVDDIELGHVGDGNAGLRRIAFVNVIDRDRPAGGNVVDDIAVFLSDFCLEDCKLSIAVDRGGNSLSGRIDARGGIAVGFFICDSVIVEES